MQISESTGTLLTPLGKLRVGLNFGNSVLASRDINGNPCGVAVDLAAELARRVGAPFELVAYEAAGRMAAAAQADAWDVAFLAADPGRADQIIFTEPYLEIDSTYLVPAASPLRTPADVDRQGVRVAISDKSAYDLFLTRNLKHAQLVRAPGPGPSVELFFMDELDALAGIRPMLLEVARARPGTRVLEGRFSVVRQAIGVPRARSAAANDLSAFVEDIRLSGFLERIIRKNRVLGVSIL